MFIQSDYRYMTEAYKDIAFSITNGSERAIEGMSCSSPLSRYFSAII